MNNKQRSQLFKMGLMIWAAIFAPIWVPVAIVIAVPTVITLAGIIGTIAFSITAMSTAAFAILGVPLLFSATVVGVVYLLCKAFQKTVQIVRNILQTVVQTMQKAVENIQFTIHHFVSELMAIPEKIQAWIMLQLRQFLRAIPIIGRFVPSEQVIENNFDDDTYEQPLYEDENDTEKLVPQSALQPKPKAISHATRPSMQFPYPRESLPKFLNEADDVEIYEVFYTNLEELYTVVRALRRSQGRRVSTSRRSARRHTLS